MTAACFVDANVLVYAVDRAVPRKRDSCREWLELLWKSGAGRTGIQVLNEFLAIATRKLQQPIAVMVAREVIRPYFAWNPIPIDQQLVTGGWAVQDKFGFSLWDSLIVAAATRAECRFLLTEDLQHGQQLGQVLVVNPFQARVTEYYH